ncbi:MAG: acylneuraminate cytidylyltransferase family protein [Hyphomicrobiaceae bacterium]|nr:acylneuraminate cytidylyltransferase family protein [Hyphomicrobiaceae bacterium]
MPRIIAVVPARGGSKGIPRKNLVDLGGRPLIAWTISAARACPSIARVVVSTEDQEIAQAAVAHGAEWPFPRPAELAGDTTPMLDVMRHLVDGLQLDDADILLLLQPTSPLRTSEDIERAIATYLSSGAEALISVVASEAHPSWMVKIGTDGRISTFLPDGAKATRRQDLVPAYRPNGAIYLVPVGTIRAGRSWYGADTLAFVMPRERSLDIDEPFDLRLVRLIVAEGQRR